MTFEMLLPPNFSNGKSGGWAKHYAKKAYNKKMDQRQLLGLVPPPPKVPWPLVKASATFYLWNMMDEDGCTARLKFPQDWLVTRGYIADDKKKNIRWAGLPEQVIDRKNQRLVLEIEPVNSENVEAA